MSFISILIPVFCFLTHHAAEAQCELRTSKNECEAALVGDDVSDSCQSCVWNEDGEIDETTSMMGTMIVTTSANSGLITTLASDETL